LLVKIRRVQFAYDEDAVGGVVVGIPDEFPRPCHRWRVLTVTPTTSGVNLDSFASEALLWWKADRKSTGFSAGSILNYAAKLHIKYM